MSLTSGKFDTRIFSMAAAIKDKPAAETDHAWRTNSSYVMSTGEHLKLNSGYAATLLHTPVENSVYVPGMTQTAESTVATGKFKITTTEGVTTITFSADDFNDAYEDYVDITYDYVQEVKEAIVTNKESAIGEAVCIWPVYGSGDDCTESSIIGYYIVKVFRARVTQIPGMDTSLACLRDAA